MSKLTDQDLAQFTGTTGYYRIGTVAWFYSCANTYAKTSIRPTCRSKGSLHRGSSMGLLSALAWGTEMSAP
jgi:hypothetical protein